MLRSPALSSAWRHLNRSQRALYNSRVANGSQLRAFSSSKPPRKMMRQDSEMIRMSSIELVPSVADAPEQLAQSISELQGSATRERVPWFQNSMPSVYFRQVPRDRRMKHLVAITAVPDVESVPEITTNEYNDNGKLSAVSMLSNGRDRRGKLERQVMKLPETKDTTLSGMNLYTTKDNLLSISEFHFESKSDPKSSSDSNAIPALPESLNVYATDLLNGKFETDRQQYLSNTGEVLHATPGDHLKPENLARFFDLITSDGMDERVSPRRLCKFAEMYNNLLKKGTDEVLLDVETDWAGKRGKVMYSLALTNVLVKPTLARLFKYIESRGLEIDRVHLDKVQQDSVNNTSTSIPEYNDVAFLRFLVTQPEEDKAVLKDLKKTLPLVAKWYDDRVLGTFYNSQKATGAGKGISLVDAEVVVGLMDCVHLLKAGTDMYEFSKPNINTVLGRSQTWKIVDLFKRKFDTGATLSQSEFDKEVKEIEDSIEQFVEVGMERQVLTKMLEIVSSTMKTNLYNKDRFAFALKLAPEVSLNPNDPGRSTKPFGLFFVTGRRFTALQLRFREIARGGLRLVTPATNQAFTIESTRQFAECYDLAFAQQQKNKDIAEGGSKAVCLIDVSDSFDSNASLKQDRDHLMRKSVKAFVNSMLDLITVNEVNKEEELVYLGPDEQVTIEHINWIISRAEERGHSLPAAFMSSKPEMGFNHKEFGVTSEGVQVFLDHSLEELNYKSKDSFTVKITGGPDGDVAGNMLKILRREYGDKCKVVGIADGTGCVEDEVNGISWDELMRLVDASLPLDSIDESKLDSSTKVYTLEKDGEEGAFKRNTLHNRIKADAFIPGGGRPQTINETNWKKFLLDDGTPSSKLIVEGANLFLTNPAREKLSQQGCVIIKDSSANKCGVACSSFEIISSMLLSKDEFLRIKPVLVEQVLEKLRIIASREAQLLMTEYRKNSTSQGESKFNLVNVSIEISQAINRTTDCVREELQHRVDKDSSELRQFLPLIESFLPKALVDTVGSGEAILQRMPEKYLVNMVSTILACELVYNEGIDYVSGVKEDAVLTSVAFRYIQEKGKVEEMCDKLEGGEALTKEKANLVAKLLRLGGPRAALNAGGVENL